MTPKEYETYVSTVIRKLKAFKGASIYRNRRFAGIRQPGSYEVDIAFEMLIEDRLSLLFIVECKNWKRVVTRSEVQKLIQTRDAIAAHKAAIVSPVGFSGEAIKVARANGVALWVLAKRKWVVVQALLSFFSPLDAPDFFDLRRGLIQRIIQQAPPVSITLAPEPTLRFADVRPARRRVSSMVVNIGCSDLYRNEQDACFERILCDGGASPDHGYDEILDSDCAQACVAQAIVECIANLPDLARHQRDFLKWEEDAVQAVRSRGLSEKHARRAVSCVVSNDLDKFLESSKLVLVPYAPLMQVGVD